MALSQTQTGAIIAGCAGAVLIIALLMLFFFHSLHCFTFSRRRMHSLQTVVQTQSKDIEAQNTLSSLETISLSSATSSPTLPTDGLLIIPTGCRTVDMALEKINHVLTISGLRASAEVNTTRVPMLALNLPRPPSMTPSEQVDTVMSEISAAAEAKEEGKVSAEGRQDSSNGEKKMDVADCNAETVESGEDDGVQDIFVVGADEDEDVNQEISVVVGECESLVWGTGKGMAQLYVMS